MARILMIVAQTGFKDVELFRPKAILEKAGHKITIATIVRAKATGINGASIQPDIAVHEANPDYFDCIVIVGGPGSPALAKNDEVLNFVRNARIRGKLLGAICLGPMTLANAGVLNERHATVFPDSQAIRAIREGGGIYETKSTVIDGKIITSAGPEFAEEFAMALSEKLR